MFRPFLKIRHMAYLLSRKTSYANLTYIVGLTLAVNLGAERSTSAARRRGAAWLAVNLDVVGWSTSAAQSGHPYAILLHVSNNK
jgi:hypothetical protein